MIRGSFNRIKRHMPWEVILCIDQSGSMAELRHPFGGDGRHPRGTADGARAAGDLRYLGVDLSEHVSDPVEVLMSVQLGGGTNIGQAVRYCEQLVSQPRRTVLVLVTDFCEGAIRRP